MNNSQSDWLREEIRKIKNYYSNRIDAYANGYRAGMVDALNACDEVLREPTDTFIDPDIGQDWLDEQLAKGEMS